MNLSRVRTILAVLLAILLVVLALFVGGGWYYAGEIEERAFEVRHEPASFDLRVASLGDGRVTLEIPEGGASNDWWGQPGVWGLQSQDTYHQVGRIIDAGGGSVVREFIAMGPLPRVGEHVRIDREAYPEDPLIAHGVEFREVGVPAPLGTFPAWLTAGESGTWVVFVHGQGADRREFLRILPLFAERGHPTLAITYRNDEGLPSNEQGYYQFGAEEWEELEAAATYALAAGAEDLILVGYSMGGAIVVSFLYNSELAERVRGVILDAPALDLGAITDFGGGQTRVLGVPVPGPVTALAKRLTNLRFGIDYDAMNHLRQARELSASTPILLFHGSDDPTVPVSLSEKLADARPDIVDYHLFSGATHVSSWNHDRERYEAAVRGFLDDLDQAR